MITNLHGTNYINVINPPRPYVSYSSSGTNSNSLNLTGTVRYDAYSGMQVFDGTQWITLATSPATISLDMAAQDAITWVINKMHLEREAKELAKSSPAVKAAIESLEQATKQLEIIVELTKEHNAKSA